MKHPLNPLTDEERQLVSDALASVSLVMDGRVPDVVQEHFDRLVMLLDLPEHHHFERFRECWQPTTPRDGYRLSDTEIDIISAWIDSVVSPSVLMRVTHKATEVAAKLREVLHGIATKPSLNTWREFNNDEKQCRSLERMG